MDAKTLAAAGAVVLLGSGAASAGDLDRQLEARYRGGWATLATEVYSGCSGTYSDNTVGTAGVASKAGRRFEPGELVKIDKVKVKRSRVDLLATLAEPILELRRDGPFELWDEHECRVQLIFEVPRSVIKSRDVEALVAAVESAVRIHPTRDAAVDSEGWNQRRRRPYPPDYERTLAEHAVWLAEQTNDAVAAGIETSVAQAWEAADDVDDDPDYLAGLAAGADEMHDLDLDDCDRAVDATFSSARRRAPSDQSAAWKRGYDDGQRLVFHLRRARALHACFVPVPEPPR